jgi:hypothetical protein
MAMLEEVGFAILAPLSWVINLVSFFYLHPLLMKPPPQPDPQVFNRKQKRDFGQLLKTQVNKLKKPKSATIVNSGFCGSYPLHQFQTMVERQHCSSRVVGIGCKSLDTV